MLPSLDEYLHAKNLKYQLIPSGDIVDPRILKSDWTRCMLDRIQPQVVASKKLPSLDNYPHATNLRSQLIPSSDITD